MRPVLTSMEEMAALGTAVGVAGGVVHAGHALDGRVVHDQRGLRRGVGVVVQQHVNELLPRIG